MLLDSGLRVKVQNMFERATANLLCVWKGGEDKIGNVVSLRSLEDVLTLLNFAIFIYNILEIS
jgi:hypothetical protein